jgi:hypothetical protein
MSDAPIKSFFLSGNLNSIEHLSYQFASSETRNGLWQMCIKSVAFRSNEDLNNIVALSTNLVQDLRIQGYQRETYYPVINTFLLKGKPNETKIVQFEKLWFQINYSNSNLKIFLTDVERNEKVSCQCNIYATILLQQIK